jgi:formylglycine-generating enzyme required for sulfatase activity
MMTPRLLLTTLLALGLAARLVAGESAVALATVTAGFVTGITVTSGGSGYVTEPVVGINGGGGSGATAKAVLAGDRIGLIVVLTAGSGYTSAPTVTIEAPPKAVGVRLELVPKLTVEGPAGSLVRMESGETLMGPWTTWTNVTVGGDGTVLVDLRAGTKTRFYRAEEVPVGPPGFVWIPPGTFVMGSPLTGEADLFDEWQHTVTLTRGYWMSDHETTQAEYEEVIGSNPAEFKGADRPVEHVSWNDAVEYCRKLTERERAAGRITGLQAYRLPTEAEWEYAARAGTTGPRYGELEAIAWHFGNAGGQTHVVKGKQANQWGLHDMIGNVFEWCADWFGNYAADAVSDPVGPSSGFVRVCRGGSWTSHTDAWRSADRNAFHPGNNFTGFIGFRPVLGPVR